ncbi:DNA-processing protein DprA [Actinokineospora enzanensis]|uniref:DNA-processing protein DprA n=1 Tax=Actinokineospora enzanensis TaxID=155975 RepID=UPI00037404DA|nr:DNA-processing protein DprA [Actinokineospora enzanensis]
MSAANETIIGAGSSTRPPAGARPTLSGMTGWDDDERAVLVALLRARPCGLSWSQIAAEVADAGSARAVWDQHLPRDLFSADTDEDVVLRAARDDVRAWREADFDFLTFLDADYPAQLREVHQMPPVLFVRGAPRTDEIAVSVVGSRKASSTALRNARDIAAGLVANQVTVLSGLAEGIDTVAHETALSTGGRTVAVIGTGITKTFPAANRALQEKIAVDGLVLSQFWPDAPPTKQSFPMRNATMSAYGRATIVVEAGEQSGARIQARTAVAHGRPVILMDAVAHGTNWGRVLVGAPGVFVAADVTAALDVVRRVLAQSNQLTELLAMVDE